MKKFKGFTLIELVVVIAILAILAAVAIPKFVDLSKKARRATAEAELGALRAAAQLYYASTAVRGTPAFPNNTNILLQQLQERPVQLTTPTGVTYNYPTRSFEWIYYSGSGKVTKTGFPAHSPWSAW
ncbi:MAG: prepilin-type N-terminal cleavage/methylation domain-containing protein [Candidatus Omnitrophota bacterium]